MNDFNFFQGSIARIFDKNNTVVGTGFLISEQHLLTCAHVVKDALYLSDLSQIPSEFVKFDLPCNESNQLLTAKVIFWNPCLSEYITDVKRGEDVACLEIEENLLESIQPITLKLVDRLDGHNFKIYGFPKQSGGLGMSAKGKLMGIVGQGCLELKPNPKRPITGGFSGAPIWDSSINQFIGMTFASNQDTEDEERIMNVAFAISNKVLKNDCLKFVELYSLLKTETEYLKNIIKDIYLKVRPGFWSDLNPNELIVRVRGYKKKYLSMHL